MKGEIGQSAEAVGSFELGEADFERPTRIGIVDAGSQLLKPIDRRIREIGADTIIYPITVTAEELLENCDAFVVSGGGDSVYDESAPLCDSRIFQEDFELPGLFICFGFQQMNQERGGNVEAAAKGRYGPCRIDILDQDNPFFAGFGASTQVLYNAGDCVTKDDLAPGLEILAVSREDDHETVAAFVDASGKKVGVQFHPEVDLTERGDDLFRHFIGDIAGLELNYTPEAKKVTVFNHVRSRVGQHPVVTGASGGVDSTVAAVVMHEEVGERQHVIHVDNGLMRKGESPMVMEALARLGLPNLHFIDAREDFRHATTTYDGKRTKPLQFETDPEAKRHIIGDTFARIFDGKIRELGLDPDDALLVQGTLRPDLIESAGFGKNPKKIKTHHNDTPLIREWRKKGNVTEPLSDLHKDEVRELGTELGLSEDIVWRQPFPGPGLGVRIVGGTGPDDFEGRKEVENSLREFSDSDTSVHLLPIKSVGVQGDDRTYRNVATITAHGDPDWARYMEYAAAIPKRYKQINRVIFTFGEQIDQDRSLFDTVVPTTMTPDVVELAQEVDDLVNYELRSHGLLRLLAQEPVILTKLQLDGGKRPQRLSVLRPFITNDFMVGMAAVPGSEQLPLEALEAQKEAALSVDGIGRVAIDLTSKPPGTTEWE